MTYGEAKEFVTTFLKGDNSAADTTALHFRIAIMETATLCEPASLVSVYTGSETDVFRMLHSDQNESGEEVRRYIKTPVVPDQIMDSAPIQIDEQLALAVVFYMCSYLSNKSKDKYEQKAERIISTYVSNVLTV